MRIGIIGARHVGGTLASYFVRVGHEVAMSNARGPATLGELVEEIGFDPVDAGPLAEGGPKHQIGRWGQRVIAYAFLLVTDRYPPFSVAPR